MAGKVGRIAAPHDQNSDLIRTEGVVTFTPTSYNFTYLSGSSLVGGKYVQVINFSGSDGCRYSLGCGPCGGAKFRIVGEQFGPGGLLREWFLEW